MGSALSSRQHPPDRVPNASETTTGPKSTTGSVVYALRPCGCHEHYPSTTPSQPFNDTAANRALCKKLRKADKVDDRAFALSNMSDGRGNLQVPVGDGNVWIKSGDSHGLTEASTMRWVASHTSVPVPRVICAIEDAGKTHILMEAVPGRPLADTWETRSPESKRQILAQLKNMVDELRAIPPPSQRYEAVDGGPLYGGALSSFNETYPSMYGPCPSYSVLHHQLHRDRLHEPGFNHDEKIPLPYSDDATCPPPVFTHGGLCPLNIMADGDTVTGIVQWHGAGWWPDYWEYAKTLGGFSTTFSPDWKRERDDFLTPYPEGEAMERRRQEWFESC